MGDDCTIATTEVEQPVVEDTGNYYSIHVPGEELKYASDICKHIYLERKDALQAVKQSKKARFKHFTSLVEATQFVIQGSTDANNGSPLLVANEKSSPFRAPKCQDLVRFREHIEKGDCERVHRTIWENPRYLVSSGDTPSILKEGPRYNALHVAARVKNAKMVEIVLDAVSSEQFVQRLYNEESSENVKSRAKVLTDLYLNTPDKSINETPLHFAVKFGALRVVEVLLSYPECDRTKRNKFKLTPEMIICDRCEPGSHTNAIKGKIRRLLDAIYYVPVLRAEDNSVTPTVGSPFSPGDSPVSNSDPLMPRMEVSAFAGPMDHEEAKQFRKVWKTPPRTPTTTSSINNDEHMISTLRYTDVNKGLERVGQFLADRYVVDWKEYWPFLDDYVDIASSDGLQLLEAHLLRQHLNVTSVNLAANEDANIAISPLSELCAAFDQCRISENGSPISRSSLSKIHSNNNNNNNVSESSFRKACQIFANRLTSYIVRGDFTNELAACLIAEIRLMEKLIISYAQDQRYTRIDYKSIHCRVARLVHVKLQWYMNKAGLAQLMAFTRNAFASDEYGCPPVDDELKNGCCPEIRKSSATTTSYKDQVVCVLKRCLSNYDDNKCRCVFNANSKFDVNAPLKMRRLSRQLFRDVDGDDADQHIWNNGNNNGDALDEVVEEVLAEDDDEEDVYFTPSSDDDDDDSEEFFDAPPMRNVFIEGDVPTKSDCAVYDALLLKNCTIDLDLYPRVYEWQHLVGLYPKSEREKWTTANSISANQAEKLTISNVSIDFNSSGSPSKLSTTPTSSKTWLRIVGTNSPKRTHNIH